MAQAMEEKVVITEEQKQQFENEGFFVLENALSGADLQMLREECAAYIAMADRQMDEAGVEKMGLNHKGSRYFFSPYRADANPRIREFLFGDTMAQITGAMLGENAQLFVEQYVVKAAEKGMNFSWHQDSGYVGYPHRPYLSCWCALDDMSEENGTVYMLPYSKAGTREMQLHTADETSNDLIGYFGDEPGVPVVCPAGSIAIFSSTCFHRSGFNRTDKMRRVYLAQYTAEPLMRPDGSGTWGLAEPLLVNGQKVDGDNA